MAVTKQPRKGGLRRDLLPEDLVSLVKSVIVLTESLPHRPKIEAINRQSSFEGGRLIAQPQRGSEEGPEPSSLR